MLVSYIIPDESREGQAKAEEDQSSIHKAIEHVGQLGFDINFGALPVTRVIKQMVETEVASILLKGYVEEEHTIVIDAALLTSEDVPGQNRLVIKKQESRQSFEAMVANG